MKKNCKQFITGWATPGSKTPEPIATKLGVRNYSWTLPEIPNMVAIVLRGCSRRMREISLFVTFFVFFLSFFRFFNSPTGRHSGPIFTIYTSNDALSRKEVPFGGLDDEFSHLPPFPPKFENLH